MPPNSTMCRVGEVRMELIQRSAHAHFGYAYHHIKLDLTIMASDIFTFTEFTLIKRRLILLKQRGAMQCSMTYHLDLHPMVPIREYILHGYSYLDNEVPKRKMDSHTLIVIHHVMSLSWGEASQVCSQFGGHLPVVTTAHMTNLLGRL